MQNIASNNHHPIKIATLSNHTNINNNNIATNTTRSSVFPPPPSRNHGSSTQACAACKYQRRKCAADCVLAPFFPHDRQREFLNAHKLFGVSNIVKIVKNVKPEFKETATRTIIYQSEARAADPVYGCTRIIRNLEQQIRLLKAELELTLNQLALHRAAAATRHHQQDAGDSTMNGDPLVNYDEKWRGEYVGEDGVVTDDVNSWSFVQENLVHGQAESTSSSFPHHQLNNQRLSMEESSNDMKPFLDQLSCDDDDVKVGDFKIDAQGNIIPSNSGEERATFKDDDSCFPYV